MILYIQIIDYILNVYIHTYFQNVLHNRIKILKFELCGFFY
jgi:hypothetical protein